MKIKLKDLKEDFEENFVDEAQGIKDLLAEALSARKVDDFRHVLCMAQEAVQLLNEGLEEKLQQLDEDADQ